jgi:hypothetical protein
MRKILFSAVGIGMLLGAAPVFAQGAPLGTTVATDLPWSINRQADRNLDAYVPDSARLQTNPAGATQPGSQAVTPITH